MLDSVIRARNKWLKKSTGLLFPSHATIYFSAINYEDVIFILFYYIFIIIFI